MRRLLFLLMIPFFMAGKSNAQVSYEIEGHTSVALEELSRLADGTGLGGSVAVTYPFMESNMIDLVARAGFNHYGTRKEDVLFEGDILIGIDSAYQGIPITGGARLYYGDARMFYVEGQFGVEIKRGDFDDFDLKDETYAMDPAGSVGVGLWIARRLGIAASFSLSNDLWRYVNLGVSLRFGG